VEEAAPRAEAAPKRAEAAGDRVGGCRGSVNTIKGAGDGNILDLPVIQEQ
jgi:hypothetical protein